MVRGRGKAAEAGEHGRTHVGAEGPTDGGINIALVVGAVDPSERAVIPSGPVGRGSPEFLHHNRMGGGRDGDLVIPLGPSHGETLAGIFMGNIEDPVATPVRQTAIGTPGTAGATARHPPKVKGPVQAADDHHIVSPRPADRVDQGLHPGGREGPCRPAVPPNGPRNIVGFVVNVEDRRGIVGISRRQGGPEGHGVGVGHVLLGKGSSPPAAARRGGGAGSPGPMKVQVDVSVVGGTVIDHRLDHGPVGRDIRSSAGIGATEPIILVQAKPNDVTVPDAHSLGGQGHIIHHADPGDGGHGSPGPTVPRHAIFQAGEIDPLQAHRATIAIDDLVPGNAQGRWGGLGLEGQDPKPK